MPIKTEKDACKLKTEKRARGPHLRQSTSVENQKGGHRSQTSPDAGYLSGNLYKKLFLGERMGTKITGQGRGFGYSSHVTLTLKITDEEGDRRGQGSQGGH